MMRKLAVVGAATGVLLTASIASAQNQSQGFGQKGEFVFSADRLVPVLSFTGNKISDNNGNPHTSVTQTGSAISFLWGGNSALGGGAAGLTAAGGNSTFYTTPRVGFDYVFLPNWTLGGDLFVFFTLGGGNTTTSDGTHSVSNENASGNAFGLAPRVGYIFGLNNVFSFWLRGGLSFYHAGTGTPSGVCNNQSVTTSLNVFGLDIDPQFVIAPAPHLAFTAGPAVDVGFAGSASRSEPGALAGVNGGGCNTTTTTSYGYSSYNIGLTGGLIGWF